jgi:hypothetical protein
MDGPSNSNYVCCSGTALMARIDGWYVAAIPLFNLSFLVRKFLQLAVGLSDIAELIVQLSVT